MQAGSYTPDVVYALSPDSPQRTFACQIIRQLRDTGHTAYLAGGCVRDRLLGIAPKDYDIATDAEPQIVRKLFKRTQAVGAAFGVILVYPDDACIDPIEVATFRKEAGYSDHRRPDQVEFTNAEEDAQRRDFTVNALFEDPLSDPPSVIDFVDGVSDLNNQTLRAVGDPAERFAEDYLRMLRAVRFAARFGFNLEQKTAAAIRPLAKHLGRIARERIGQEVLSMLSATTGEADAPAPRAAALLQSLGLDGPTFNEDHQSVPLPALSSLPGEAGYAARLTAWCLDRRGVPAIASEVVIHQTRLLTTIPRWRKALCLTNQVQQDMNGIVRLMIRADQWPSLRPAHKKRLLAEALWPETARLLATQPNDPTTQTILHESPTLIAEGVAPEPWVDGDTLIASGLKPGPLMGRLLAACYDEQLEGAFENPQTALAWAVEHGSTEPKD